MRKPRILIADDDTMVRIGLKTVINWEENGFVLVGEAANGLEAMQLVQEKKPDIVITDIKMPGMDGIELAKRLNALVPGCAIIFLTAYLSYAPDVYETRHVYFVLKSELDRRIGSALRAALAETAAPASLQLATAHGYRNVPVTDVLFLERILRKTRVVLTDGEELVTAAPAALLEAVPDGVFLRCHQSYWANYSHITAMEKDEFVLTGGLRVPISRSYRSAARSAFFANLRGEEG